MKSISNSTEKLHFVLNCLPGVSSINSVLSLFLKIVVFPIVKAVQKDSSFFEKAYVKHIQEKSYLICCLLLIPVVNIPVAIYYYRLKEKEKLSQQKQTNPPLPLPLPTLAKTSTSPKFNNNLQTNISTKPETNPQMDAFNKVLDKIIKNKTAKQRDPFFRQGIEVTKEDCVLFNNNKELMGKIIQEYPRAFKESSEALKKDYDFASNAILLRPDNISEVPFLNNLHYEKLATALIKKSPSSITCISKEYPHYEELAVIAIETDLNTINTLKCAIHRSDIDGDLYKKIINLAYKKNPKTLNKLTYLDPLDNELLENIFKNDDITQLPYRISPFNVKWYCKENNIEFTKKLLKACIQAKENQAKENQEPILLDKKFFQEIHEHYSNTNSRNDAIIEQCNQLLAAS